MSETKKIARETEDARQSKGFGNPKRRVVSRKIQRNIARRSVN